MDTCVKGIITEKFDSRLIINIKVSRTLIATLAAIYLGGMALVLLVSLPFLLTVALLVTLTASMAQSLRTHGWRQTSRTITAIELDHEGLCSVRLGQEPGWRECDVLRAVIHPGLVLLWLRIKGRRWPTGLVLAGDAVEPEAFRRLRARLPLEIRAA